MQPRQGPSKYDQFLQDVQALGRHLEQPRVINQGDLVESKRVYEYYHRVAGELRSELNQMLQGTRGNSAQIQYIQLMIQKVAAADTMLMQIENKIDTIAERLFPKAQGASSSSSSSSESQEANEALLDDIHTFIKRFERFEKYAQTHQQDKDYQSSCTEVMGSLREKLASLRMQKSKIGQNRAESLLQDEMLNAAELSLNRIENQVYGGNEELSETHLLQQPILAADAISSEVEQPIDEELISQILAFSDEVQALEQGFFMQMDEDEQGGLPSAAQQQYISQIAGLKEKLIAFDTKVKRGDQEQANFLSEMLEGANKSLNKITAHFQRNNNAGSSSSNARPRRLSDRAKLALGPQVSLEIAMTPLISNPWSYNAKGESSQANGSKKNDIHAACTNKKIKNSDQFYRMTKSVCDLFGDGCCGSYCIAALLLQRAIDDPAFKELLIERADHLSALWDPIAREIEFQDGHNIRKINKDELVRQVTALLKSLKKGVSLSEILTKENGQLLNLFFRTAIREAIALKELSGELIEALQMADSDKQVISEGLKKQYKEIEEPVVHALNEILDVNIGMINFDGTTLHLPDKPNRDGYLIRTKQAGGHFLAAFPRT